MPVNFRLYRGLKSIRSSFHANRTLSGHGHNYEDGFDAAVRIEGRKRKTVSRAVACSGCPPKAGIRARAMQNAPARHKHRK